MPFAGHENHVAGACEFHRLLDRLLAIRDRQQPLPVVLARVGGDAAPDLVDDAERVLAARIVRRHDDHVAQASGDGTHQRPLGPIAIAAAAEHGNQPAGRQRPRRLEQIAQRIVGVCVVDDHGDAVGFGGDDLEPAGDAGQRLNTLFDGVERQIKGDAGRDRGEDVVNVRSANQPRADAQSATRGSDVE